MFELRVQKGVEPHSFCIGGGIFATSLQNLSSNSPHKKLWSRSQEPAASQPSQAGTGCVERC